MVGGLNRFPGFAVDGISVGKVNAVLTLLLGKVAGRALEYYRGKKKKKAFFKYTREKKRPQMQNLRSNFLWFKVALGNYTIAPHIKAFSIIATFFVHASKQTV